MSQDPRDDRELDAFLARDSALQRRWRDEAGDDEPPAGLDAVVRAAARRAVGAGPRAHGPFSGRWRVPLSIAAVVAVSATVTLMVADRRDHLPTAAPERGSALAPAEPLRGAPAEATVAPTQESVESQPAGTVERGAAGDSTQRMQDARVAAKSSAPERFAEPAEARRAPRSFPDSEEDAAPAPPAKLQAEREPAPRETAADRADAPAPRMRTVPSAEPAPAAGTAASPPAIARTQETAPALPAAPVPAAGALHDADSPEAPAAPAAKAEARAKRQADDALRLEESQASAAAEPDSEATSAAADAQAQRWIERIRALRRAGKLAEAEHSLREFRKRYPQYRLPADLRELPE